MTWETVRCAGSCAGSAKWMPDVLHEVSRQGTAPLAESEETEAAREQTPRMEEKASHALYHSPSRSRLEPAASGSRLAKNHTARGLV